MNSKIIPQATRFKERPFLFYDKVVLKLVERVNIKRHESRKDVDYIS